MVLASVFFRNLMFFDKIWKKSGGTPIFFRNLYFFDENLKKIWGYSKIFFEIWHFFDKSEKNLELHQNIFLNLKIVDKNLKKITVRGSWIKIFFRNHPKDHFSWSGSWKIIIRIKKMPFFYDPDPKKIPPFFWSGSFFLI